MMDNMVLLLMVYLWAVLSMLMMFELWLPTKIQSQADVIAGFAQDHCLCINPNKTEVVAFAKNARDFREDSIHFCGEPVVVSPYACCLGYWWYRDLLCIGVVEAYYI